MSDFAPTRSTRLTVSVLAGMAAVVAITYALATPTVVRVTVEKNGVVADEGSSLRPLAIVFIAIQVLAAIAAMGSMILVLRDRYSSAKRLLEVAAVAGLIPTVLPGVLALAARVVLGRMPSANT